MVKFFGHYTLSESFDGKTSVNIVVLSCHAISELSTGFYLYKAMHEQTWSVQVHPSVCPVLW